MKHVKTADNLRIRVLGNFRMNIGGKQLPPFPTREAELLFTFLLLHRDRLFQREVLVGKFFTDQSTSTARKRLRTDIWRIRSILEPEGTAVGTYLTVTNREVGFNRRSSYWLDVQEFEVAISKISSQAHNSLEIDDYNLLTQALELYRGELLEGIYDEWCVWEKERLKILYLRGLETLMNHHAYNFDWNSAIFLGQQLLSEDPLREHIHRSLMRYYYQVGDRPAAMVQYDNCARLLRDELDIEPMRETSELFHAVKDECAIPDLTDERTNVHEKFSGLQMESEQQGLCMISSSVAQLDEVTANLKKGISLIEEFIQRSR